MNQSLSNIDMNTLKLVELQTQLNNLTREFVDFSMSTEDEKKRFRKRLEVTRGGREPATSY